MKDPAAKVSIDKPKAKIKAKKVRSCKDEEAAVKLPQYICFCGHRKIDYYGS